MYVGVLLLVRQPGALLGSGAWLDGAIGGLAAAALAIAILQPGADRLTKGDPAEVATNLAYPLGDVLLLSFLIAGFAVAGLRAGRSWLLIGIGIATWGVADAIYLYQDGDLDLRRRLPRLALAGRRARDRRRGDRRRSPRPRERREAHSILFPALFGGGRGRRARLGPLRTALNELSIWLAVATLGGGRSCAWCSPSARTGRCSAPSATTRSPMRSPGSTTGAR